MQDIPNQYKKIFDVVVLNIKNEVEMIVPFIEELGAELRFDVDNFTVSIKKKSEARMYNKRKLQRKKRTVLIGRKKRISFKTKPKEQLTKSQINKIKDIYTRKNYREL